MNRFFATILVVVAALATACGGSSPSGGVIGPGPNPPTASFAADVTSPGSLTVSMVEASSSADVVTVSVDLTGINGVFSAGFDVEFDPQQADYVNASNGSLLEQGGTSVNYAVNSPQAGYVVAAASRTGTSSGTDVTTTRTLLNLVFRVKNKGSFPVVIRNGVVRDSNLNPIQGLSWHGGSLVGS